MRFFHGSRPCSESAYRIVKIPKKSDKTRELKTNLLPFVLHDFSVRFLIALIADQNSNRTESNMLEIEKSINRPTLAACSI